ncbi:MAG: hypothetical protein DDT30_01295 [Dehalococcoidia bacterium]|nr:hypothetical protein [Bacillota bacterium]
MGRKSRNKKTAITVQTKLPSSHAPLAMAVFVGLCLLVFYPPYLRAMFFTTEQLPTHMFTLVLFILWWIVKYQRKDTLFLVTPLDWFVFAFALIYFLTLPIAINIRGAIQEFLKVANYFLVYWLASQIITTKKQARIFLNVLIFSALGVAILGQGAALKLWEVHGGFVAGRIFSTIQYPNSLAAYLTGAFFVTLGLFQSATIRSHRLAYIITAFILILTVILTYSRGGWLIVPFFSLLYILFISRPKKKEAALVMVALFTISILITPSLGHLHTNIHTVKPAAPAPSEPKPTEPKPVEPKPVTPPTPTPKILEERFSVTPNTEYTLSFEIKADGPDKLPYIWRIQVLGHQEDGKQKSLASKQDKKTDGYEKQEITFTTPEDVRRISVRIDNPHANSTMVAVKGLVLACQTVQIERSFFWSKLLPRTLYDRLFGFSRSDINVVTRFRYFQDAWEIIKDYPVFGLGGHGWKSRYFQYQSALYSSTEVHNHFLQVWVETGIIGLLIFLGIWLAFIHTAFSLYRGEDEEKKIYAVAIGLGVLAVVLHSLYDFNLSLGAIGIFLWALMGVLRSLASGFSRAKSKSSKIPAYLPVALAAMLLLFVAALNLGHRSYLQGVRFLQAGQFNRSVSALEQAVRYDKFDPEYRVALANAYEILFEKTNNYSYLDKVRLQLEKAYSLDRYNPTYSHYLGSFLVRFREFDEGLAALSRTIDLQPQLESHYNNYAKVCLNIASFLISQGQRAEAEKYIEKALSVEERLLKYYPGSRILAFSFGKANYLRGNIDKAREYLETALNSTEDRALAAMILSLIYEKKGDTEKAKTYYASGLGWDAQASQYYDYIKGI